MKEKYKHGFHRFCDGTSCHGFTELYYAKSIVWKVAWVAILILAFALSAYQIYTVVRQYIDQPFTTTITPAKESEILYPPMRLCYMLWLYWIDWSRALSLGFSKEAILYGLNYINIIYTSVSFNVSEAEAVFKRKMAENNFRTLTQFYSTIAKDVPIFAENNFSQYIDRKEIYFRYPGYMLCYTISEKRMYDFFVDNLQEFESLDGKKMISFQTQDITYANLSHFMTKLEYNRYMLRWIKVKSMYKIHGNSEELLALDLSHFSPPVLLFTNGYSTESVDIFSDNDAYAIDLTANSRRLKNTDRHICVEGVQSFASNRTCSAYCRAVRDRQCTCRSIDLTALLDEDNQLDSLCHKGIVHVTSMSEADDLPLYNSTYATQSCSLKREAIKKSFDQCLSTCLSPCQIWTWDVTVSITTMSSYVRQVGHKLLTNVTIEYPMASKVILMNEELFSTWENMLGNIGGLLGVWTGASLISIVQLFYLCCFADITINPGLMFQCFGGYCNNINTQRTPVAPVNAVVLATVVKPATKAAQKCTESALG